MTNQPLRYSYDERLDVMTIEGVRYSGQVFRLFAVPLAGRQHFMQCVEGVDVITERRVYAPFGPIGLGKNTDCWVTEVGDKKGWVKCS
jgi:hypothetical protein